MGECSRFTGGPTCSVSMLSNGGGGSTGSCTNTGGGSVNCVLPKEPSKSSVEKKIRFTVVYLDQVSRSTPCAIGNYVYKLVG